MQDDHAESRRDRDVLAIVEDGVNVIVAVALVAMMVMVTLEAVTRYVIGSPFRGVVEIVTMYFMPAIVFLSLARTQRMGKHVAVDIVQIHLSGPVKRATRLLICILSIAIFAVVGWTGFGMAVEQWGDYTLTTPSLPVGPSRALVPLGCLLMILRLVVQSVRLIRGEPVNVSSVEPVL